MAILVCSDLLHLIALFTVAHTLIGGVIDFVVEDILSLIDLGLPICRPFRAIWIGTLLIVHIKPRASIGRWQATMGRLRRFLLLGFFVFSSEYLDGTACNDVIERLDILRLCFAQMLA